MLNFGMIASVASLLKWQIAKVAPGKTLKRENSLSSSNDEEYHLSNRFYTSPKRVRVICTDPDATDSSSNEEDDFRSLRNLQRRLVQEIYTSTESFAVNELSSDSELDEP